MSRDDTRNDGRNLDGQLEMCREYAQSHGWRFVAELAEDDRGASGASFELPQLNRVREMAWAGEFDILVVQEIDRLTRSLAKQLIVEMEAVLIPILGLREINGESRGVVFGRNVMQAQDPAKFISALCEMGKEGANPGEAAARYGLD